MAPIRLGIIGLSQSAKTSWASQAHLPYLLSERGRSRYQIVALLNSTKEAAKKAVETYGLTGDVKTYGSAQDFAADPDVELVVCSTRVDVHYNSVKPSVEAGKNTYVEWPLSENVARATELLEASKKSGATTLVGLQSRVAPTVRKVKETLQSGIIGKVLSSEVQGFTANGGGYDISEGLGYFLDKKIGGNSITIAFAHTIDYVHSVLGEYESSNAHLQIQRPNQKIVNRETGASTSVVSDVPDLISVHGTLRASELVEQGASLLVHFKSGPSFPGSLPFTWLVTGDQGRLRVTNKQGPFLGVDMGLAPVVIEVEEFSSGEVKQIEWKWEDWQEQLSNRGRSIAKLYDLYYEGKAKEYGVADFESAVTRHAQIDGYLY